MHVSGSPRGRPQIKSMLRIRARRAQRITRRLFYPQRRPLRLVLSANSLLRPVCTLRIALRIGIPCQAVDPPPSLLSPRIGPSPAHLTATLRYLSVRRTQVAAARESDPHEFLLIVAPLGCGAGTRGEWTGSQGGDSAHQFAYCMHNSTWNAEARSHAQRRILNH